MKGLLAFALGAAGLLLVGCDDGGPSAPEVEILPVTMQNVRGMWYCAREVWAGTTSVDGVQTGTLADTADYPVDSAEVWLFGATACHIYRALWGDCYEEEVAGYGIQNGRLAGELVADRYYPYDPVNGYFENWLYYDSYLYDGGLVLMFHVVGRDATGDYDSYCTLEFLPYTANLPNPNWPQTICTY